MNIPDQRWPDPSPMHRCEPTDAEIAEYAAYLKPKLLVSKFDIPELLAMGVNGPSWDDFAVAIHAGDHCEAGRLAALMLDKAATDDAERIASDVLYGDDYHADTLRRIGADDAATFFKRLDEERMV